jgi:hypothetical protein
MCSIVLLAAHFYTTDTGKSIAFSTEELKKMKAASNGDDDEDSLAEEWVDLVFGANGKLEEDEFRA